MNADCRLFTLWVDAYFCFFACLCIMGCLFFACASGIVSTLLLVVWGLSWMSLLLRLRYLLRFVVLSALCSCLGLLLLFCLCLNSPSFGWICLLLGFALVLLVY